MAILLPDYSIAAPLEFYIDFVSFLSWYRMFCGAEFGETKQDYLDGFKSLKDAYDEIWLYTEKLSKGDEDPITDLFRSIELLLSTKKLTDNKLSKIATLLLNFENEKERDFRIHFIEHITKVAGKEFYKPELYGLVGTLLENNKYEEAVLNAFKHLDGSLQKLVGITSHNVYGEDLINFAFAPNNGKLQLNTHPNEQQGLRNFFSGVNSLFRNPVAHRFMNFDEEDATTIIAMVALMVRIAAKIAEK